METRSAPRFSAIAVGKKQRREDNSVQVQVRSDTKG